MRPPEPRSETVRVRAGTSSWIRWLFFPLLGGLLGVLSAAAVLGLELRTSWIRNGPWRANLTLGSPTADAHTRALGSVAALFALEKSEAVYFFADRDSEGRPLRTGYDYRVEGGPLAAGWWSLTLYGADLFLVPNSLGRYSFGKQALEGTEGTDGSWTVSIAKTPRSGHWLPSGDADQRFYLVLRLYHPADGVVRNASGTKLPVILREGP